MKYLIRSIKYLIYFVLIFFLIVGLIYLFSTQKQSGLSFTEMFQEGSFPKLAIFFLIVAALYPALGFGKRNLYLNGEYSKYADIIDLAMRDLEYEKTSQEGGRVVYRCASHSKRLGRMYEDAITFDIGDNPVVIEGFRKDTTRVLSTVSYRIRQFENPEDQE